MSQCLRQGNWIFHPMFRCCNPASTTGSASPNEVHSNIIIWCGRWHALWNRKTTNCLPHLHLHADIIDCLCKAEFDFRCCRRFVKIAANEHRSMNFRTSTLCKHTEYWVQPTESQLRRRGPLCAHTMSISSNAQGKINKTQSEHS